MEILNIILAAIAAFASVWGVVYAVRSNKKNTQQLIATKEIELQNLEELCAPNNQMLDLESRAKLETRIETLRMEINHLKGKK